MRNSLQRHLSLVLGGAVLLAGLVAATASFSLAYFEAKELQDDMLRQIAMLSLNRAASIPQQLELNNDGVSDPDSRVTIFYLPSDSTPAWLKNNLTSGLHTLNSDVEEMRVFVRRGQLERVTIVVQPTEARNEIAINSALRTLIPLLLLLPVLAWLIFRIVRNQLAPIARLSKKLDEQPADRPQSIVDDELPDEITPFVHAINRLLNRVNHLMGQQRRFIADAAHELRSPLAAVSLQAENLMSAESLDVVHERLIPLRAGIQRARQLTEQLLNLAKTQTGANGSSEINISVMAREMIADYLPLAEAKNIDLGLDEVTSLSLRTDPEGLRLILRNALENALKYAPNGGEVTLRIFSDEKSAIIEIIDNGQGIPVSEYERVFDAFYRIPGSLGEGSGLGLAIAKEAAIKLGGTLSLHARQKNSGLVVRYSQARQR
jgi:two-component system OmpR family sensor kinase